jgi:hypothetical protein
MKATKEKILIGCGVWMLVLPFTGFPRSWKTALTFVTGVLVAYIALLLWRSSRRVLPQ